MPAPKGNCFNPEGRPKKPIDWATFEELCNIQCTQSEIASVLRIDHETLTDRVKGQYGEDFSTVYKRFAEGGRSSLRRTQFKLSNKNAAMCIWLGKQYLGQRDMPLEQIVSEEVTKRFDEIMEQLGGMQKVKQVPPMQLKTEVKELCEVALPPTNETKIEGGRIVNFPSAPLN